MSAAAEERIPAPASGEEIFFLAAGFAVAALETHQGANTTRAKKPHQGIFSKNRRLRISAMWAKWSGTHQDRSRSWSETVLGSALDANGNTLSDPSGKSYSWDLENRLVSAVVQGSGTVTFKYDPFGRRIQKSSWLGTTNYLYDGIRVVEMTNATGAEFSGYAQGPAIDEPLAILSGNTANYYQGDEQGSITALTNSSGTVVQNYVYDAYGNTKSSSGTLTNPFQYTAREFDSETGLYYDRARYYNPTQGRFLSEDPIGFGGGNDFYPYADNNPVAYSDPFGLQACSYPDILVHPCMPPLYGPPVDPTAPPPPPAPTVPGWWPGTGPGSGSDTGSAGSSSGSSSSSSSSSGVGPSPGPGPGPAPGGSCSTKKTRKECTDRRNRELDFCNEQYSGYPNLLRKCRARANERWSACLRGNNDPGPLDPLDPTWAPE